MGFLFGAARFLGLIGSWISSALDWVLHSVTRLLGFVCAGLLVFSLVQIHKNTGLKEALRAEKQDRADELQKIAAASELAYQKALQAKQEAELKSQLTAQRINDEQRYTMLQASQLGAAYKLANLVRPSQVGHPLGNTSGTGQDHPAGSDIVTAPDANLVAISSADFDVCTENSVKLLKVYNWGVAQPK